VIEESRSVDVSLEPLDEFVVVQPVSDESETRAGLILPASATEAAPCRTGIVTAVGSDVNGVDAGDKVLFGKYSGQEFKLDGQDLLPYPDREPNILFSICHLQYFHSSENNSFLTVLVSVCILSKEEVFDLKYAGMKLRQLGKVILLSKGSWLETF